MPELPDHWLLQVLAQLRDDMRDQHARLRSDMTLGFNALREELRRHDDDYNTLASRVTVIETERRSEEKLAVKRGTWAGLLASAGLTGIVALLRWLAGSR